MEKASETVNGSESADKKRSWNQSPSVKLMPEYRGARVIEGENGGEELIGQFFPWNQVFYHDKSVRLVDEQFERLRVDDSNVTTQFIGGSRIAFRLKHRAIKQWTVYGTDPIEFEPPIQSIRGWYWGAAVMVLIGFGTLALLVYPAITGTAKNLQGVPLAIVFGSLSPLLLMFAVFFWIAWGTRPRKQSFDFVRLMPQGLVGESRQGVVSFEWDELRSARNYPGNQWQVCYVTDLGNQYWVNFPRSLRSYPRFIHAKPGKPPIFGANRYLVVQGLRFFVIAVVLGLLSRWVIIQFPNWVPNAPPFPSQLSTNIFWMMFSMPAMMGVLYLYLAVKTMPKVRRRMHALTKRYDQWKKHREDKQTVANIKT